MALRDQGWFTARKAIHAQIAPKGVGSMLGFLFGFNARLGRLHYFLCSIALAVVMTGICFAIAMYAFQGNPAAMQLSTAMRSPSVIAATVLFTAVTLTLQSMRFRDIGWDPVCVIPGWIALLIVDHLIANKFPAWALGQEHQGTIVGGLVNLGLLLALTFWPSGDHDDPAPTSGWTRPTPDNSPRRGSATPIATARIARVTERQVGRWTT